MLQSRRAQSSEHSSKAKNIRRDQSPFNSRRPAGSSDNKKSETPRRKFNLIDFQENLQSILLLEESKRKPIDSPLANTDMKINLNYSKDSSNKFNCFGQNQSSFNSKGKVDNNQGERPEIVKNVRFGNKGFFFPVESKEDHYNHIADKPNEKFVKNREVKEGINLSYRNSNQHNLYCCGCSCITKLFKTSTCSSHLYCEKCFGYGKQRKVICEKCEQFFLAKSKINKVESQCILCNNIIEKKLCPYHSYCKTCFDFLLKNTFDHLTPTSKCKPCIDALTNLKNFNEETIQIMNNTLESKKIVIPLMPPNRQINNFNRQLISYDEDSKKEKNINFVDNKKLNININESLKYNRNKSSNKESSKRSNSAARDSRYSFINILNEIRCFLCNSTENNYGFLCNHNLCIVCLTYYCSWQIYFFFSQYQVNKDIYKNHFNYLCPINGCSKKISVPTMLIYGQLNKFILNPRLCNSFQCYQFLLHESFLNWIPYFDGLMIV